MKKLICILALLTAILQTSLHAQVTPQTDGIAYTIVPNYPRFGETSEDLQRFIQKNTKLPTLLEKSNTSRNVISRVIIEPDGTVTFEGIISSPDEKLEAEAKRIIGLLPKFNPGYLDDGGSVRTYYVIPFWFE